MASIILAGIGAFGGSLIGGSIGLAVGQAIGATIGSHIDNQLFAENPPAQSPRDIELTTASEGVPIARVFGRMRSTGQIIWTSNVETQASPNFAGGYEYLASFAIGICEGEIQRIGRIWVNGMLLDQTRENFRIYRGTPDQEADELLVTNHEPDEAPCFRHLAYIVFERLSLNQFGSSLPQFSFEVFGTLGRLENSIRSVNLVPGSSEFSLDTRPVVITDHNLANSLEGPTTQQYANLNQFQSPSDIENTLDEISSLCPNLEEILLVVNWFGDGLDPTNCQIKPGHLARDNISYSIAGVPQRLEVESSHIVQRIDLESAQWPTPNESSLRLAIAAIKNRGLKVALKPVLAIKITDPAAQKALIEQNSALRSSIAYHALSWRSFIGHQYLSGASRGESGGDIENAIRNFFGQASAVDFDATASGVRYLGSPEDGYRKFILFFAALAQSTGGIDRFLIGSELECITRLRTVDSFPGVSALADLATEARSLLGTQTTISYAANWQSLGPYRPSDAPRTAYFHLDELWASADIDAVAIEYNPSLVDLRDQTFNEASITEQILRGEGADWYYASSDDRRNDRRSDLPTRPEHLDAARIGKPKDLANWWHGQHVETTSSGTTRHTQWENNRKPIWISEFAPPPSLSGLAAPHQHKSIFSQPPAPRDDYAQRLAIETFLNWLQRQHGNSQQPNRYSFLQPQNVSVWSVDARPFPAYPSNKRRWSDTEQWTNLPKLNGRLGSLTLRDLVGQLCERYHITQYDSTDLHGVVGGIKLSHPQSLRNALEPLARLYNFAVSEQGDTLIFSTRSGPALKTISHDQLVFRRSRPALIETRNSKAAFSSANLTFVNSDRDYQSANSFSSTALTDARENIELRLNASIYPQLAYDLTTDWLARSRNEVDAIEFSLAPDHFDLSAGDILLIDLPPRQIKTQIAEVYLGKQVDIRAQVIDPEFTRIRSSIQDDLLLNNIPPVRQAPEVRAFNLSASNPRSSGFYIAASQSLIERIGLWRSPDGQTYDYVRPLTGNALIGKLMDVAPGISPWHIHHGPYVRVEIPSGSLESVSEATLLDGANKLAVQHNQSQWELWQFGGARLVGRATWELSRIVRGSAGTEHLSTQAIAAGSSVVVINSDVAEIVLNPADYDRPVYWRVGDLRDAIGGHQAHSTRSTATDYGTRPFTPVSVTVTRVGDEILIAWIARRRHGGGSWNAPTDAAFYSIDGFDFEIRDDSNNTVYREYTTFELARISASHGAIRSQRDTNPYLSIHLTAVSIQFGRSRPFIGNVYVN